MCLGVAFLLLVFAFRQPILTEEDALGEFPADRVFSARVHRGRTLRPWGVRDAGPWISPSGVAAAIRREIDSASAQGNAACCVLVGKPKEDGRVRHLLAAIGVLKRWPSVGTPSSDRYWVEGGDNVLPDALHAAGIVILIVPEGSPRGLVRAVAEELVVSQDDQGWILVLIRRSSGRFGLPPGAGLNHPWSMGRRDQRRLLQRESS